jgi:lipid-A-disaccharide synthase-like uncharacterized protein
MSDVSPAEKTRKRVKWEPAAALVLVIFLGFWLALGPDPFKKIVTPENARRIDVRLGENRVLLVGVPDPVTHRFTFQYHTREGHASPELSEAQISELLGPNVVADITAERPNRVFRWLRITSWASLVWVGVGFFGQAAFSSRFLIQWIASEKSRRTVVPEAFWWMSLIGGISLFAYFVWRQDPVAILGQSSGLVIYARNIRLIYKQRRREARELASGEPSPT